MSTIGNNPSQNLYMRSTASINQADKNKSSRQANSLDQSISEFVRLFNDGQFDLVTPESLHKPLQESLKNDRENGNEPGTLFGSTIIEKSDEILNFDQRMQFQKAVLNKLYELKKASTPMPNTNTLTDKEELDLAVDNVDQMLVNAYHESEDKTLEAKVAKAYQSLPEQAG